jgi:hypothetical protein
MRYVPLLETKKRQPTLETINGLSEGLEMTMTELVHKIEETLNKA